MIPQDFLQDIANEHHLSNAELDVLSMAMAGESTRAIAEQLGISGDAVRKRLSEVYQKFEIGGRGPVKLTRLQQILVNRYQKGEVKPLITQKNDNNNYIDWEESPETPMFYGRKEELATLERWIIPENCRILALTGMGGIGKTALSVKLVKKIKARFDYVIWRSLRKLPTVENLLSSIIKSFGCQEDNLSLDEQISWLTAYFRSNRCLIILDGFDSILSRGKLAGVYLDGYQGYGQLLHRMGEEAHRSCFLLTSREKVRQISLLEGRNSPVRSLKLEGLGAAARPILQEKGLSGEEHWDYLINTYRGNPLMLKLVANTIQEVFDGNVSDFVTTTLFTHDVTDFVAETLGRLSELESKIVFQMARKQEPISLPELQNDFSENSAQDIVSAVASLKQRSLLEKANGGFSLIPIVMAVSRFDSQYVVVG